jgi:hypothetical protein
LEKTREVSEHFPSWQPQQLSFHLPKPKHSQDESYTNNLHFKKNLVKIGRPYQKLLTFGGLKTILPHCAVIWDPSSQWKVFIQKGGQKYFWWFFQLFWSKLCFLGSKKTPRRKFPRSRKRPSFSTKF